MPGFLYMLSGIVTLLLFTVIGNLISDGLRLPVPGSVIGLFLLMIYLQLIGEINDALDAVSQFCIRYLAVLFIPGCVGIFFLRDLLMEQWLPVLLAMLVATPITLGLTALLLQWLLRQMSKESGNE